jgi:hypothetical protein
LVVELFSVTDAPEIYRHTGRICNAFCEKGGCSKSCDH